MSAVPVTSKWGGNRGQMAGSESSPPLRQGVMNGGGVVFQVMRLGEKYQVAGENEKNMPGGPKGPSVKALLEGVKCLASGP